MDNITKLDAQPTHWMSKLEQELEQPTVEWPDEEPTIPAKLPKGWLVVEGGIVE